MRAIRRLARPATAMAIALAAALAGSSGAARAELLVAPLRQVITAKDPVALYRVSNPSDRIVEARLDWMDLSATPDGYVLATPTTRPGLSAAPYLVISPARLRLEPGGHAEVVVRLKKGAAIPAGERRSHLLIETTPSRTPLRRAGTGLEVDVGLGVSTPVILRGGYAAPAIAFGPSRLVRDDDGLLALETTLTSNGKYSAYGTIEARLGVGSQSGAQEPPIARLGNVAIYPDSGARKVTLPLRLLSLPEGALRIEFKGADDQRARVLAAKTFDVGAPPPAPGVSADR